MKLLDPTTHFFSPFQVIIAARELQTDDPDHTYQVVHDPNGPGDSFIVVYDETGKVLGTY